MYAIVEISGKQFKVVQDQKIFVSRLKNNEEGSEVSFDTVMLKDNDGNVTVGKPYIEGASVKATVLKHLKGPKVLVFKKIRRKGFQKMNGYRDYLTQIKIDSIN
ncbi:MAG: 50S ribosomal protein L21 [Bacteroidales bacterium]|nr:50S ribosomal protein L21 [Bacteroidales bacterium]